MKPAWPVLAAFLFAGAPAAALAQQGPPQGGFGQRQGVPGRPMPPGGPPGAQQGAPMPDIQPAMRWVDVHFHLVADRQQGSMDFVGAVRTALEDMDRAGIAVAVVMPPPHIESQQGYDYPSFASALKRHPQRFAFLGGGWTLNTVIHKYADPATVTGDVKRKFVASAEGILNGGAVGFGEMAVLHLSATQNHPFEQVSADHPLFLALAEVAGQRGVPIELHLDAVDRADAPPPEHYAVPPNPPRLKENIAGFERLLAHDRRARIVWAHGGSDPLGMQTPSLVGRLMDKHSNLSMSLRVIPDVGRARNKVLVAGAVDPAWLELFKRHPDRFMLGTDTFSIAPGNRSAGPGAMFSQRNLPKLAAHNRLLAALPPDLAKKIGDENPRRIYRLTGN